MGVGISLYLVIVVQGTIHGTVGPLDPLTMQDCLYHEAGAYQAQRTVNDHIASRRAAGLPTEPPNVHFKAEEIRFGCTYHMVEPQLGDPEALFTIFYPPEFTRPPWLSE